MGFITNTDIVLINARYGLKFEAFVGYQELIESCLLKLTDSEFAEVVEKFILPRSKTTETFISSKPINQKNQPDFTGLIADALKSADNSKSKISAEFLRRSKAAGCQCGKQKLEGMPLCGICYTNLPNEIKSALRKYRGGELEQIYLLAVNLLTQSKRDARKKPQ